VRIGGTTERRTARTRSVGVRVTEPEYLTLEGEAWKAGKTLADWARDQILSRRMVDNGAGFQERTVTELVGIERLLIDALLPLLRGERMPPERVETLLKQVQATKGRKAKFRLFPFPSRATVTDRSSPSRVRYAAKPARP
jgi:hypothetical protein